MKRTDLSLIEKVRWSLHERLCEQMRLLTSNFFDEVDDFLFGGDEQTQYLQDSAYLQSAREIRREQQKFENYFLQLIDKQGRQTDDDDNIDQQNDAMVAIDEQIEVELALNLMKRKAGKFYLPFIKRLQSLSKLLGSKYDIDSLETEMLLENTLAAFSKAQGIFKLPLEMRLVFLKLFEQHFLLKMERLYMDTVSIVNNIDDEKFVERLYSSSSAFKQRQTQAPGRNLNDQRLNLARSAMQRAEEIEETVNQLVNDLCSQSGVPAYINQMIGDSWRSVLLVIGLNNGVDSAEWQQAISLAGKLTVFAANATTVDGMEKESLRAQLERGFKLVQWRQAEQNLFFQHFDQNIISDKTDSRSGSYNGQRDSRSKSEPTGRSSAAHSVSASEQPKSNGALNDDEMNELANLLDSNDHAEDLRLLDDSMNHYLKQVDELEENALASYCVNDMVQDCTIRKSTTVSDNYLISNPFGQVILTRSRLGLAISLREGELRLEIPEQNRDASDITVSSRSRTEIHQA